MAREYFAPYTIALFPSITKLVSGFRRIHMKGYRMLADHSRSDLWIRVVSNSSGNCFHLELQLDYIISNDDSLSPLAITKLAPLDSFTGRW